MDHHQANTRKYTLLKCIGKGQYGRVFKAIDRQSEQIVAIKYVSLKTECTAVLRAICREVKILINLGK